MTGKDLFSKSSPILFGVRLNPGPDMAAGIREAHALGADFVGMQCEGNSSGGLLENVFGACGQPGCGMGLCLFLEDNAGSLACGPELAALLTRYAQSLPLLVASGSNALLLEIAKAHPAVATGLVLPETCACGAMQEQGVGKGSAAVLCKTDGEKEHLNSEEVGDIEVGANLCVLSRGLASGCRLCGLRTMGVCALVTGTFTRHDVVRMSLDGADAFLLDDMADFEKVATPRRRKSAG